MSAQNYSNHRKYYAPHHFIFYPVILIAIIFSVRCSYKYPEQHDLWITIAAAFAVIGWLSFMLRQHYALNNQNRIVRLEMRLRYFILTNKKMDELESKLTFGQIAALRFASDEELLPLIDRTLAENLSPNAIKKSIKNWVADDMRV
ncbi:DUF6526 family protein [Pinibacter aurantiacus]|uniref:Uncharacterized protein n=1 Tax=Pinibacter aurantiacus TaxID=2851599 RepID=A0A9E2SA37_9BACT|nr:DUF6526 family protein [Pinibacter aurantiacus]MBV4357434.1 hypothetical protein [Pinibacter aurantiacus]